MSTQKPNIVNDFTPRFTPRFEPPASAEEVELIVPPNEQEIKDEVLKVAKEHGFEQAIQYFHELVELHKIDREGQLEIIDLLIEDGEYLLAYQLIVELDLEKGFSADLNDIKDKAIAEAVSHVNNGGDVQVFVNTVGDERFFTPEETVAALLQVESHEVAAEIMADIEDFHGVRIMIPLIKEDLSFATSVFKVLIDEDIDTAQALFWRLLASGDGSGDGRDAALQLLTSLQTEYPDSFEKLLQTFEPARIAGHLIPMVSQGRNIPQLASFMSDLFRTHPDQATAMMEHLVEHHPDETKVLLENMDPVIVKQIMEHSPHLLVMITKDDAYDPNFAAWLLVQVDNDTAREVMSTLFNQDKERAGEIASILRNEYPDKAEVILKGLLPIANVSPANNADGFVIEGASVSASELVNRLLKAHGQEDKTEIGAASLKEAAANVKGADRLIQEVLNVYGDGTVISQAGLEQAVKDGAISIDAEGNIISFDENAIKKRAALNDFIARGNSIEDIHRPSSLHVDQRFRVQILIDQETI